MVYTGPLAPTVLCDRCHMPANADRIDITPYGEPPGSRWLWGWITCSQRGCVDETGSPTVLPPDEPGGLTRDDRKWLDRHRRIADDYARTARALLAATEGW